MTTVNVTTGARLHFGLLCGAPDSGWHYGGIGMMVDAPSWKLHLSVRPAATDDVVKGSEPTVRRVTGLLAACRQSHPQLPAIHCEAASEIDYHAGLGAGTQLTLAIASGLRILQGQPRPANMNETAASFGRSRRSAIGTLGFDQGGFLIDYGKNPKSAPSTRFSFPEQWRMILFTPLRREEISGEREEAFFGRRRYLESDILEHVSQVVSQEIEPSLKQQQLSRFRTSLATYGRLAGAYYAQEQGGVYSSPVIRDFAAWLKQIGLPEPVQSSWGPTVCIPTESEAEAEALTETITHGPFREQLKISVCGGLNAGAIVSSPSPESHQSVV